MTKDEKWDNHARQLQAKMVMFSVKHAISVVHIENWLVSFSESGMRRLKALRDLANIFIEYQSTNKVSDSNMKELIDWLTDEAMLHNIEEMERKNK